MTQLAHDPKAPRRPTLADVARLSGVAPVTVSRALNLPDLVNRDTRERVMTAVASLGYQANTAARVLAGSRWNTVGVQVPSLDHIMLRHQLQVFEAEMSARNISLLISATNYDVAAETRILHGFVARGVDAILMTHLEDPDSAYDLLERRGVPSVLMAGPITPRAKWRIGYDDEAAMAQVANHLADMGHRTVAMLGDSRARRNGERRIKGLTDALGLRGIALPDDRVTRVGVDEIEVEAAFDRLMAHPVPPTALVCGNDWLALVALALAAKHRISVPEQLSVTGFDGDDVTAHPLISLSTIRAPWRRLGSIAAEMIVDAIEGKTPRDVILPTELILRRSTAGLRV